MAASYVYFLHVQIILEQIRRKHAASICDDVMEVGWSFLWNITGYFSFLNTKQMLSSNIQFMSHCSLINVYIKTLQLRALFIYGTVISELENTDL